MIWVFLFYILPLLLAVIIGYKVIKNKKGSKAEFIEYCVFCLVPPFNIVMLAFAMTQLIEDSDMWNKLKNSKL